LNCSAAIPRIDIDINGSPPVFYKFLDAVPDAMILVDRNGRIVSVNSQAEQLFGYDRQELVGAPIEQLMPEHVRRMHQAHLEGYVAAPHARQMGTGQELSGLKRGGTRFSAEIALSPVDTQEGQMFLAAVRDVSETHRAHQARARVHYDACVARIGQIALAATNLGEAIEDTPELVAQTLGADAALIALRTMNRLKEPSVQASYGIDRSTIEALPWTSQLLSDEAATSAIHVPGFRSHALIPLIDRDETVGILLVLSRSNREFDREAMHFLRSVANLLAVAMQRIRVEEQLAHAQRLESVGQLTGGIAHDFNNLLTVISGNLQILEDELADRPAAREIVGNALRAAGRGADLTHKLLVFARRQRLAPRASDPHKLLEELASMLRRTLGESVHLAIHVATGVAPVFADPAQLESALVNLALNSRDAMPRGGELTLTVEQRFVAIDAASAELKPGHYVVFGVRDTGLGMAKEVLARAFEPFFTTKDVAKGSGLGLSMVYGFAKQSGGHVQVHSKLGYGTGVELYLPAAQAAETPRQASPATSPPRGRETILVVEDEADVREIAIAFLRSFGYTVLSAARAEPALEMLSAHGEIALLFSDVVLGSGMSGKELAVAARRLRPMLGVLLTSGYEPDAAGPDADEFALLPKPYRREELSGAVRAILDRR
jgi:PAS domain S-box-containing protein